jgi:glutathione S-transferase
MNGYRLVSHHLCPYVQRVAIALAERGIPFERVNIDLANKPDWFVKLSPLGKVPLLRAGEKVLFESAVILEYLEDTLPLKLHPADPLARAEHRGWMEFGSATLNAIAGLYNAPDAPAFELRLADIRGKLERLENALGEGPWFAGEAFSLVDAVWGPVFRYFDVFAAEGLSDPASGLPKVSAWRMQLRNRQSVAGAVAADYPHRLAAFLRSRNSHMSRLLGRQEAA